MQPFVSRRSLFAASLLAVFGLAADPNDAGTDGSSTADAAMDAGLDSSTASDATVTDSATADAIEPTADANVEDGGPAEAAAGSSEGVGFVQDDGGLPIYTGPNIFDWLCEAPPDSVPFSYSSVQAPYTTADACKTFGADEGHTSARACLCDSCFALQQQCDAIAGCRTIQKCGWDTGCHDSNSCYLVQGLCATQINNAGTGSVSTALSQAIETCGSTNMCPVQ